MGDRVSSTEYNPSYFSGKTKELFTSGQRPALAARAAFPEHASPSAWPAAPLCSWQGTGPMPLPWERSYGEGESALGLGQPGHGSSCRFGTADSSQQPQVPAGKATVVPAPRVSHTQLWLQGKRWKSGHDMQPGHPVRQGEGQPCGRSCSHLGWGPFLVAASPQGRGWQMGGHQGPRRAPRAPSWRVEKQYCWEPNQILSSLLAGARNHSKMFFFGVFLVFLISPRACQTKATH